MEVGNANFQLSHSTILFDVLKIRKRVDVLPLKVEVGMDWKRDTQEHFPFVSVRDKVIDGEIRLQPHEHHGTMAVYQKNIPNVNLGNVHIRAGFALGGFKQGRGFHPFFGVGYGGFRGQNTSAMMTNDGIDFKQRVPLHRHFKMEVCGNAKLPLPQAQYEHQQGGGQISLGEGAVALHIAQLNPVIYV